MSYYYNYYIGYKLDNKIYPLGPYDSFGKLNSVLSKSRSFASDLYEDFSLVKEEEISDELRKEFEYEDWDGRKRIRIKYLPLSELPNSDFIKTGYFLIKDIEQYEKNEKHFFDEDIFYKKLTPTMYSILLQKELLFGKNEPKKDIEGEEYTEYNASDYMYYAYPDYNSKEFEVTSIYEVATMLDNNLPKDAKIVVLETEG